MADPFFDEVLFPISVGYESTGGPGRSTQVVAKGSGFESRNARWLYSRRKYDAGSGVKTLDQMHQVIGFHEARNGMLYGFRWYDYLDDRSCPPLQDPSPFDQPLQNTVTGLYQGDGVTTTFQAIKQYVDTARTGLRKITKPTQGPTFREKNGGRLRMAPMLASVNNVAISAFTFDPTTGIFTFGAAPGNAFLTKWGGFFHVPVRFDTDELTINYKDFQKGISPSIPIRELRIL